MTLSPRHTNLQNFYPLARRCGRKICLLSPRDAGWRDFGLQLLRCAGPVYAFLTALLCCVLAQPARATIRYEVSLANPSEHLFHVSVTVPDVRGALQLQMPAWNALYQIRDFSSRVQQASAESNGKHLEVEKLDKLTWRIRGEGTVCVRYAVFWDSPGPFASQLNEEHAFINPAMVFLYVPNRRAEAVALTFHDLPKDWEVATPLDHARTESGANLVHTVSASGYDAFCDGPMEVGVFRTFPIEDGPRPVAVAIHGDNWKQADVEAVLKRICPYEVQLMGGAPFNRYLFILHIGKAAQGAGGGMEHANGTAINVSSGQALAGVAAHEFFHLWNVKRIRPASLEPIDYTREQYTRALWFAEGVTSTYGSYTLVRSGIWSKQDFYGDLAQNINELESRPANRWQSAEQSSLDAWLEKYSYYNGPDFSVSYYSKGQILGLLLDILIRDRTGNEKSLDDVMRKMNDDFARKGKLYRDSLDIRLTVEAVAGGSFADFFENYVAHAEGLPYAAILGKAGLLIEKQEIQRPDLGFALEREFGAKVTVRSVVAGSTAERAGLKAGDEIETWNGESVPRRVESWLRTRKPGDILRLQVRRNEQLSNLVFALGGRTDEIFVVSEDPKATAKAQAIRAGLVRGSAAAAAAN